MPSGWSADRTPDMLAGFAPAPSAGWNGPDIALTFDGGSAYSPASRLPDPDPTPDLFGGQ